jgi:hypothetical protein
VPSPIGILLLLIKPQLTIVALLYMALDEFKRGGIPAVFRMALIPAIAVGLAILAHGFWFLRWTPYLGQQPIANSLSFFPGSVPVGLALFWWSLRKQDSRYAVAASPCFFPILSQQTWLVTLIPVLRSIPLAVAISIVLWIIAIIAH